MRYGREVRERLEQAEKLLAEAHSMAAVDKPRLASRIGGLRSQFPVIVKKAEEEHLR